MMKGSINLTEDRSIKILLFLILAVLFGLVYVLNNLFPLFGEDWDYAFVWTMDGLNPNRLTRLSDIFSSQYSHYMIWGGRSIGHTIDQFLILIDPIWRNLLNTLAYVFFVYITYKIINLGNRPSTAILFVVVCLLWFLLPNMPTIILWKTYSSIYLWTTLITVFFMYPYYKYYRIGFTQNSVLFSCMMFLAGVVAGWSVENLSLSLVCFVLFLFILMRYVKLRIPRWMLFGFAGVVIGCILLLLAPGNFKRAGSPPSDISLFYMISYRIWDLLREYIYHISYLLVAYLIVLYFFLKKYKSDDKHKIKLISFVFVVAAHFGLIVMLASPIFPARTLFGPITFMIVAIGILFVNIPLPTTQSLEFGSYVVLVVLTLLFIIDYQNKYAHVKYFHDFWKERKVFVQKQKEQGIRDIVFEDALVSDPRFIETTCDFKSSVEGWPNFSYAKYYELNTVRNK